MNKSFDDALLSNEDIRQLEFECKLEFANSFNEIYLAPLQDAISLLPTKKAIASIKHIGHKIGGHAEFPKLIPFGEILEKQALEMMEKKFTDVSVFKAIFSEIVKIYETEITEFINENKK